MGNIKILLVVDESIEALNLKHVLEYINYEVPYVASSCEEAIENASIIIPDIILMDLAIKYSNDKVLSQIKNLNIPIIYLITNSKSSKIEDTNITGRYNQIIKPYDHVELKYSIKHKLEKQVKKKFDDG